MAGESSACSCAVSHSRPSSASSNAESNPTSPRTPIAKEGRLDFTAEDKRVDASPAVFPLAASVDKEISFRENGAALSLIERLEEGWYRENVVSWPWWNIFSSGRHPRQPTTAEVMWGSRDLCVSSKGELSGIKTPELNGTSSGRAYSHLSPLRSIEMVQPLVVTGSSSAERESRDLRDLPTSRLRRLQRGLPDDEMSLSDGEQRRYRSSRRSKSKDADALRSFGDMRIETTKPRAGLRRKEKQVAEIVGPPRRFSDGEEPGEDISAPLERVREEGESEVEGLPSSKTSRNKSSAYKNRDSWDGKTAAAAAGKQRRSPIMESNFLSAPPPRRKRRERRKSSKSLSEVEYDELRGCMDLGFNLSRDDLTPGIVGVFPSLKFSKAGDSLAGSPKKSSPRTRTNYAQGWGRRADAPLLKWRIPSPNDGNVDMKAHLKFWAHSVASSVSAEC